MQVVLEETKDAGVLKSERIRRGPLFRSRTGPLSGQLADRRICEPGVHKIVQGYLKQLR